VSARVYATAHGIYELFVNGVRVGDHELTPGFTAYRTRLAVQIFAPTALYDVAAFSIKWLRDLAADQRPDGRPPNWAPELGLDRRSDPA
jgi:hypothetical protein